MNPSRAASKRHELLRTAVTPGVMFRELGGHLMSFYLRLGKFGEAPPIPRRTLS
jgi:hypothetical protein